MGHHIVVRLAQESERPSFLSIREFVNGNDYETGCDEHAERHRHYHKAGDILTTKSSPETCEELDEQALSSQKNDSAQHKENRLPNGP